MIDQVLYSIGVDISKDSFHACILTKNKLETNVKRSHKFPNSKKGFISFSTWINKLKTKTSVTLIVMEATGVYWENLAIFIHEQMKMNVSVVNPRQIKHFAHTNLRRSKTDPLDAHLIAKFGLIMNPKTWIPFDPLIRELKQMLRERVSFIKMITEEKNRLSSVKDSVTHSKEVIKAHQQTIIFLKKQVKNLESLIETKIRSNSDLSSKIELIKTIPGVGNILASTVLLETNALEQFESAKQLACFVGIAPSQYESGNMIKRARISKVGNSHIRRCLYMSSLSCVKHNSKLKEVYIRLKKKGKASKVVLIAVARKLLHIIFAVLKSGIPFNPNYISKNPALVS